MNARRLALLGDDGMLPCPSRARRDSGEPPVAVRLVPFLLELGPPGVQPIDLGL
jgi:hypothetical protein